ncbi:MAG: methyltransferase domain-containing protein [bacterium]
MKLSPEDKQQIVTYYQQHFKRHGLHSAKSFDWGSNETQLMRFAILAEIGNLQGSSILDVGCGLGDFYNFLTNTTPDIEYVGIDIVPDFHEGAQKKHPEVRFILGDFLDHTFERSFDYAFASGTFSLGFEVTRETYYEMIGKMFLLSTRGVGFNMLHYKFHTNDAPYLTYDPKEVKAFCSTLTKNIEIVTGYLEHDFTVYLRK